MQIGCNQGKRKGETLELYQRLLSEIPIKNASSDIQNSIVKIADEIITKKIIPITTYHR